MVFIIVRWSEVNDGMDETEDEAFCGPADYYIDRHVVVVCCDLVCIAPLWKGASIAQKAVKPRRAAVPDPGKRVWSRVKLKKAKRRTS